MELKVERLRTDLFYTVSFFKNMKFFLNLILWIK